MRVNINEKAFVEIDPLNHTLYIIEPKKNSHLTKTAGMTEKLVGYYKNMEHCLEALLKYKISTQKEELDLKDYYQLLKNESTDLKLKLEELKSLYTLEEC